MRWLALFLVLGCSSPTDPASLDVWFQGVPEERYSYDPSTDFAFQAHATQTPPDWTYWELKMNGTLIGEGVAEPGVRAGHRWYIPKGVPARLVFTAWGQAGSATTTLDYPSELPPIVR